MEALVDGFGRAVSYLRVSVTDRCNLRCGYCMPPGGIARKRREEILRFDELERLAALFVGMGVGKLRLTGGEPLIRHDIERLIARLARIEGLRTLGLTTNGVLLEGYAAALRRAGLERLNVSLDSLRAEKLARITGRDCLPEVLRGIDAALEAGFAPLKLNVVVVRDVNDDELLDFVELTRDRPLAVRFIEYMRLRPDPRWDARFVPCAEQRRRIEERFALHLVEPGGAAAGQVAKTFSVAGFAGSVGFITPVSEHFCGACNRLRLLADGALKWCLFQPNAISLRDPLRAGASDAELVATIRRAVAGKWERPANAGEAPALRDREMVEIGG